MSETIPLKFTAIDNLTKGVDRMTKMLEQMTQAQDKTAEGADKTTKATERQSEASEKTSITLEKVYAGLEIAKTAYESVASVVGFLTDKINKGLSAWDEQSKKTGKSASPLGAVSKAQKNLTKETQKFWEEVGKAVERSGAFQLLLAALETLMKDLKKIVKDNSDEIDSFSKSLSKSGVEGLTSFSKSVKESSEGLSQFLTVLSSLGSLFKLVLLRIEFFVRLGLTVLRTALAFVATAVQGLVSLLAEVIELTGAELPEGLKHAKRVTKDFADTLTDDAAKSFGKLIDTVTDSIDETKKFATTLWEGISAEGVTFEKIHNGVKTIGTLADNALAKVTELLKALFDPKAGNKPNYTPIDKDVLKAEARLVKLAELDQKILEARSRGLEGQAAYFELQKSELELNYEVSELKTRQAKQQALATGNLTIQLEYQQKVSDLITKDQEILEQITNETYAELEEAERSRLDNIQKELELRELARKEMEEWEDYEQAKRQERYEIAMANIKSRQQAEIEAIRNVANSISETFDNIPNVIDGVSESTQRMFAGFSKAAQSAGQLAVAMRVYGNSTNGTKQQTEALNAAIGAGVGVASSAADALIENERQKAAILSLINFAAAAAALAGSVTNPALAAAAIQYGVAGASYAAAAAFSGGGSSGGSMASVGASNGGFSAGGVEIDRDVERRATAEAIAEAIGQNQNSGGIIINVDFGNAVMLQDSPQTAQTLTDILQPELERVLRR